nr:C2 calcium/lipid-binding domain, CaLB [Tanacetum cinerariifolium]
MSQEVDDDIGYDPSDVAFTEWLGSNFFNYKTMDHYTRKALWIYWIRGDDEVELKDEEFSNNEDEVAEAFRIDTNIFDFETPMCKAFKEFNYLLQIDPDLLLRTLKDSKLMKNIRNLPGAYIVENSLHYQDYEWYKALMDSELKEQALKNKAIMEGLIRDDESSNDGWRRWEILEITYHDHDEIRYENMKLMMKDKSYVKLTNCRCSI